MTFDFRGAAISLSYIAAAVLFIFGLQRLSSPKTARSGNRLAAVGMFVALVATLFDREIVSFWLIALGVLIGAIIGVVFARRVPMTAMPQMVALFNGAGGATAALVSIAEYIHASSRGPVSMVVSIAVVLGTAIGAISFSGSLIAFGKLQEILSSKPLLFPGQRFLQALVLLNSLGVAVLVVTGRGGVNALWWLFAATLTLGALATLAIGGGDMPVVIAVLNSLTGLATAITGLELNNEMLIVAGMLVGASGTLLTLLMSKAMNRSLGNVLFSGFGAVKAAPGAASNGTALVAREANVDDTAIALAYARRVIIIPGYGLAVAQAQHELQALASELGRRGVDVRYAIHPVAGRMPGHMNVLLAEANVPYDQLVEMEQVNGTFESTDVALVVGANDVVNPAAREDPSSPIYGMPILDADKAKQVVVLKRGMSVGFAGIDNALFYRPNTRMLFGDARKSLSRLVEALKSV
ncbi:MAG: NAD(P)(+) transhydrogenase (Re/Si-specific) subunit beta [Gemmatimonadaceae bacterium]